MTLEDETLRQEIARSIRPSLIFNLNGSVVADAGAEQLVDLKVQWTFLGRTGEANHARVEIQVSPNRRQNYPPIVQPLHRDLYAIEVKRGEKLNWLYTFTLYSDPPTTNYTDFAGRTVGSSTEFRLELFN